jgi:hypothetical protein
VRGCFTNVTWFQQAKHFTHDHYMCQWRECLDKKFIVFDSDIDLKAHEVNAAFFWFRNNDTRLLSKA